MNIASIVIEDERRLASGTNLYNIVVEGRSLEAVLCRANGIAQKSYLEFQVKFEEGNTLPFVATFIPTDDGWVKLVDIIPCTEQGNMFI